MTKIRGYTNTHQVPKLEKIVLNCSVGSATDIKVALEDALNDLTMITGQKPIKTRSKKSISNFNLRLASSIQMLGPMCEKAPIARQPLSMCRPMVPWCVSRAAMMYGLKQEPTAGFINRWCNPSLVDQAW
jgi:hypothetical protein